MFCAGYNPSFFRYAFPLNSDNFSDETFFLQLHHCLFVREYFGNQASLTNCSGTLIWLADSTASAPPVRKNKGSFQRVSFQYYSHELSFLSFNFPWYFPEKSGSICFIFRYISFNIQWILFVLTFFVSYLFKLSILYSFIYSFIYSLFIRLFIRLFVLCFFALSFELISFHIIIYFVFLVFVKLC